MGNYARKSDRHSRQLLSRDAKKLSPEDCHVHEEEIDENTFEKGEAFPFQEDDDSYVDPYALSHVDEKLHNVLGQLGHFLEDFQGDLSAEKLGARFGGYGSFLGPFESSPPRADHEIKHNIEEEKEEEEDEDIVVVIEAPVMKSSVLYMGLDHTPTDREDGSDSGITL